VPLGLSLEVPFSLNNVIAVIIQKVQNSRLFEFVKQSNVSSPACIKRICFNNIFLSFWRIHLVVFGAVSPKLYERFIDIVQIYVVGQYFEIYKRCQCS